MWHCPHCGAPQAETARCWVCRRSSTTCSTCRHFRASLVSDIGYCALDRARRPLTGLELRGCWTQDPAKMAGGSHEGARTAAGAPATAPPLAGTLRGFVALEEVAPVARHPEHLTAPVPVVVAETADPRELRTSLFGELDR